MTRARRMDLTHTAFLVLTFFSAAEAFANDLLKHETSDDARIQKLYRRAYGRPAEKPDFDRAMKILAGFQEKPAQAWTWLCQTVLASNEFAYMN